MTDEMVDLVRSPEEQAKYDAAERAITGRAWKNCEVCRKCRIPSDWNPPWCTGCGGPQVNCRHCRTGRDYWIRTKPPFICSHCGKNPLPWGKDD